MTTTTPPHPVTVNGETRHVPAGSTLFELLERVGMDPAGARGIAVAVNDEVVRRTQWQHVVLGANDRVEIITAKQGG